MVGTNAPLSPPVLFQLIGHPLRWRLLSDLSRSDRTVRELTDLAGESQNLVSYHLGKLRDARLVTAHQSSGDRRDTYYAPNLAGLRDDLATSGAEMHPYLRLSPDPPSLGSGTAAAARVLFLCTGNSARSQMAEALIGDRSVGRVEARSAGSHPKPIHPNAVRVMREHGIDLSGHRSKHLSEFVDQQFDVVVSLCDRVREICPEFPGAPETVHWSIADPAAGHAVDDHPASLAGFRHTAAELEIRIALLLAALAASHDPGADPVPHPTSHPTTRRSQEES